MRRGAEEEENAEDRGKKEEKNKEREWLEEK